VYLTVNSNHNTNDVFFDDLIVNVKILTSVSQHRVLTMLRVSTYLAHTGVHVTLAGLVSPATLMSTSVQGQGCA
jgi:hypothetical protein